MNPSAGHEHLWGGDRFAPAAEVKTVLVVGGGPAGCEALRIGDASAPRLAAAIYDGRVAGLGI